MSHQAARSRFGFDLPIMPPRRSQRLSTPDSDPPKKNNTKKRPRQSEPDPESEPESEPKPPKKKIKKTKKKLDDDEDDPLDQAGPSSVTPRQPISLGQQAANKNAAKENAASEDPRSSGEGDDACEDNPSSPRGKGKGKEKKAPQKSQATGKLKPGPKPNAKRDAQAEEKELRERDPTPEGARRLLLSIKRTRELDPLDKDKLKKQLDSDYAGENLKLEFLMKRFGMNATDSRKKTVAIPVLRDRILEARGRLHDSDAPRLGNPPDNYEDTTRFCPPRYDPEDRAQREADAKELERSGNKAKRENDSGVAKDDGSQTNKVNKTPKQKPEERRDKDTGTADHGKSTTKQKQDAKEKPTKGTDQPTKKLKPATNDAAETRRQTTPAPHKPNKKRLSASDASAILNLAKNTADRSRRGEDYADLVDTFKANHLSTESARPASSPGHLARDRPMLSHPAVDRGINAQTTRAGRVSAGNDPGDPGDSSDSSDSSNPVDGWSDGAIDKFLEAEDHKMNYRATYNDKGECIVSARPNPSEHQLGDIESWANRYTNEQNIPIWGKVKQPTEKDLEQFLNDKVRRFPSPMENEDSLFEVRGLLADYGRRGWQLGGSAGLQNALAERNMHISSSDTDLPFRYLPRARRLEYRSSRNDPVGWYDARDFSHLISLLKYEVEGGVRRFGGDILLHLIVIIHKIRKLLHVCDGGLRRNDDPKFYNPGVGHGYKPVSAPWNEEWDKKAADLNDRGYPPPSIPDDDETQWDYGPDLVEDLDHRLDPKMHCIHCRDCHHDDCEVDIDWIDESDSDDSTKDPDNRDKAPDADGEDDNPSDSAPTNASGTNPNNEHSHQDSRQRRQEGGKTIPGYHPPAGSKSILDNHIPAVPPSYTEWLRNYLASRDPKEGTQMMQKVPGGNWYPKPPPLPPTKADERAERTNNWADTLEDFVATSKWIREAPEGQEGVRLAQARRHHYWTDPAPPDLPDLPPMTDKAGKMWNADEERSDDDEKRREYAGYLYKQNKKLARKEKRRQRRREQRQREQFAVRKYDVGPTQKPPPESPREGQDGSAQTKKRRPEENMDEDDGDQGGVKKKRVRRPPPVSQDPFGFSSDPTSEDLWTMDFENEDDREAARKLGVLPMESVEVDGGGGYEIPDDESEESEEE